MTKPTDDLEAVRVVTEALQGFETQDQERIIRWAREKLGLASSTAAQLPTAGEQIPPTAAAFDLPVPRAATPTFEDPRILEHSAVEVPEIEQQEAEHAVVERPGVVDLLMPPEEQKNRAFMVFGIILLAVAVVFLIVMIVSNRK